MKLRYATIFLVLVSLITPVQAANILLVSDACAPDSGCGDNQRDDTFVEFLQDAGHTVDVSGMGEAYHSATNWWTDGEKAEALSVADLVIVSRRTNSGAYRGGIAVQAWNGLETPLMLMSAFITRDSRWGWQVGGDINAADNMETEMVILDDNSPLVTGLAGEAQVFDWIGPSLGGNENANPGQSPKNVTAPGIDSVIAGGEVIGQYSDRALLINYPQGTEWTVLDDGDGGMQDGAFGGDRVFFGHWGYDIEQFNFLDFTTGEYLTVLNNTIATLAPGDPTGFPCDFDANNTCDVADLNMLLDNLGSDDATFDVDGSGGNITLDDRDAWLTEASSISNPSVELVPGDTDLDGDVDAGDLNNLGVAWQSVDNPGWGDGDFNGDDVVNANDLNDLGVNWLHPAAAAPAAVPEPGSLVLIWFACLGLLGFRRRK